jgi:ADP-heptose:LPS heptosyltransferase
MREQPRSILVIDASPFGRSLALLSVLRVIRAANPYVHITAATASGTCELLTACKLADDTIDLGLVQPAHGSAKRLYKLFSRGRRRDYDLVLDFSPRLETQMLSRLSLRARTLTPSRLPRPIEMLLAFGGVRRAHPDANDYENVLSQMGLTLKNARFEVTLPDTEHAKFEKQLTRKGSRGGEPVVVLYGASASGWPVAAFGETGARLANNFGARVVAVDEPQSRVFTEALGALLPKTALLLSSPHAPELAAAVARASLVITDESGIAQLAAEMGAPVIEIAESNAGTPISNSHRIIQHASRTSVSPDEVYELAVEMIQSSRSASLFQS